MTLSKTHAVTSIGVLGLLVALGVGACSDKSDGNNTGGGGADGADAGAGGKGGSSGKGGGTSAGDAGESAAGAATAGDTGEGGAAGADTGGGMAGAGTCDANTQTDSANCGTCGHSCGTAECSGGRCYAEAVIVPKPIVNELTLSGYNQRTFLSGGNLYAWERVEDATQDPDVRIRALRAPTTTAIPTTGSVVQDIAGTTAQGYIVQAVNYDSTYLYQCTSIGGTRVALDASAAEPTVIFKEPVADNDCNDIVVGSTALFISSHDVTHGKDTIYTIPIANLAPTAVPTLVPNIGERDNDIYFLTAVGDNLYWMENDLAAGVKHLVTAPAAGLPANGKPTEIDADLGNESASIASDGSYLYWTDAHGAIGELRRTKLPYVAGANIEHMMTDIDGTRAGIVLDDKYAYIMEANNPDGNMVYRVAKDGPTDAPHDSDLLGVGFVNDDAQHKGLQMTGVDSKYVYFLLFDGIVGRLPVKP